jgi:hypothetical protein
MRRSLLLALVVIALSASGCGTDETILGKPSCPDHLIIVAQSVPRAAFVPCFEDLPGGWSVSTVSIGHTGTSVTFDSDRAGFGAAKFAYSGACDVSGLGRLGSEQDGVTVYEEIERLAGGLKSTRYFVFNRGCVAAHLDFDGFGDIEYAEDLLDALLLVDREGLNESLRQQNELFEV